ncbi:hypothetical protein [Pseudonocardia sp. N23]|uniref:hypothetical protein n=1 Tax=Pseudonocardia sp. N23 TaxID=1987376 RepID=UPI000BFDD1B8|nr:hypothetical protein [Pseudonocardia sp. N23]GAY12029.1 hypothetical protein TOK_0419 [Pseudonocardia sp. N23]
MDEPEFRVLVAYTRTGQIVDALDDPGWSFEENLAWSTLGKMTLTVPLPGADRAGKLTRDTLRGIRNGMSSISLVILRRDGAALAAGPVYTLGWNAAGVSIGCASLNKLFDKRMVLAPSYLGDPTNPAASVTLALPPRDRATKLIDLAMTGVRRGLPITLPSLSGVEGDEVTYAGVDLRTTAEAVKAIVEADGGPDILLLPQVSDDQSQLSWTAAIGDPALGAFNPDATWDYPLVAISGDVDDSETTETAYVVGDSSGSDSATRLVGVATVDRGEPWPALERADRTSVSEARQTQLDALATSYGAEYSDAVETITYSAPTDLAPAYRTAWNLGDTATFAYTGHPWLDDGTATARMIGVAMDPGNTRFSTKAVA